MASYSLRETVKFPKQCSWLSQCINCLSFFRIKMYPVQFTSLPMKWICQECHIFLMDPEQRNQIYLWGCCKYSPSPLNLNYQPGVLWLLFGESVNKKKKKKKVGQIWQFCEKFGMDSTWKQENKIIGIAL